MMSPTAASMTAAQKGFPYNTLKVHAPVSGSVRRALFFDYVRSGKNTSIGICAVYLPC